MREWEKMCQRIVSSAHPQTLTRLFDYHGSDPYEERQFDPCSLTSRERPKGFLMNYLTFSNCVLSSCEAHSWEIYFRSWSQCLWTFPPRVMDEEKGEFGEREFNFMPVCLYSQLERDIAKPLSSILLHVSMCVCRWSSSLTSCLHQVFSPDGCCCWLLMPCRAEFISHSSRPPLLHSWCQ